MNAATLKPIQVDQDKITNHFILTGKEIDQYLRLLPEGMKIIFLFFLVAFVFPNKTIMASDTMVSNGLFCFKVPGKAVPSYPDENYYSQINITKEKYSGGSGTSGNPYILTTPADIVELSNSPDDWGAFFEQTANISFNADESLVDWDGDGNADGSGASGLTPIGNNANRFTGKYDGKGNTISNLFIDRYSEEYMGLFGVLCSSASVQNLGIVDANITGDESSGGLVGDNYGLLDNCYTTGFLKGKSETGGIAGNNFNTITNCYSTMEVTVTSYAEAGGLVGYTDENSVIKYCYSAGTVNGNDEAGGFVGDNHGGVISQCFSTGNITGKINEIGGFVGVNYGDIENCYSFGDVTTNYATDADLGGFCGSNSAWSSFTPSIEKCYSLGSVFFADHADPTDFGFVGNEVDGANTSYTGNFFDAEASNQTEPNPSGFSSATAKTTTEMNQVCTFLSAGWDFADETGNGSESIWTINTSDNNAYPALAWQGYSNTANPTNGGTISSSQSICYNTNAATFSSSTSASGGAGGGIEYKWQYSNTGPSSGFTDINNSNSLTYNPGTLTEDRWYSRLARTECVSDWSGAASSNVVRVTVYSDFNTGEINTEGETIRYNGDPDIIESNTDASGGDDNIAYRWQSCNNESFTTPVDISSSDDASFNPPAGLTEDTWYRRQAKDGTCNSSFSISSGIWKVKVSAPRVINDEQNTQFYYIQEAINGANPGDRIIVMEKTGEHLYIDKELIIEYDYSGN